MHKVQVEMQEVKTKKLKPKTPPPTLIHWHHDVDMGNHLFRSGFLLSAALAVVTTEIQKPNNSIQHGGGASLDWGFYLIGND